MTFCLQIGLSNECIEQAVADGVFEKNKQSYCAPGYKNDKDKTTKKRKKKTKDVVPAAKQQQEEATNRQGLKVSTSTLDVVNSLMILNNMGFEEKSAREALRTSNGNFEDAIELLQEMETSKKQKNDNGEETLV